jgi:hypothetical protein
MDRELEEFKSRIDLREYAAAQGYELDRRESSRASSVMRHAGDKVVIRRDADSHYVYFSVHDDADNGTVIDFAQKRKGLNLGQLRKELRPWLGRPPAPLPLFASLEPSPKDRQRIERNYAGMRIAARHAYLEQERKIPPALLGSARFAGRIRADERGNAVFPHFDGFGLSGYELKNLNFTGFASGGEKGLWESHDQADDAALVFAESAIDALSHAALFPDHAARYRSIGGALNPQQPELIKAAIATMPSGGTIICATDNDDAGRKLAQLVEECFLNTGRPDLRFKNHLPENENTDWNNVLQATPLPLPAPSFPTARPSPL